MKRTLVAIAISLFATSIASADPLPVAPIASVKPISPGPASVPTFRGPTPVLLCPDPAATSIDFSIASRSSRYRGRARITGTVKNVGTAPYVSGPNQQLAELWEVPVGGRPRLVAQRAFQNLEPGAEVTVTFERDWYSASPAEGEFPPTYRVTVAYDPDIRIDGNVKNDDCNGGNNVRERSGADINGLFR